MLHRLAAVRVETSDDGVLVVNVIGRRRLEWAEMVGVRLLRDDPWMMLDLSDGQALAAMGVQKSEGERAQRQAREFARLVQRAHPGRRVTSSAVPRSFATFGPRHAAGRGVSHPSTSRTILAGPASGLGAERPALR